MRRLKAGLMMAAIVGALATGVFADDSKIARTIVEKLQVEQQRGELKGFNIGVRVDHGDVWIEGEVADPSQQTLVLEIARRVHGVKQVVNDIKLTESQPPTQQVSSAGEKRAPAGVLAGMGAAVKSALAKQAARRASTPAPITSQTQSATTLGQGAVPTLQAAPTVSPQDTYRTIGAPPVTSSRRTPQMPSTGNSVSSPSLGTQPTVASNTNVGTGVVSASNARLAALARSAPAASPVAQLNTARAPRMASQLPVAFAPARAASMNQPLIDAPPVPAHVPGTGGGVAPATYDHPHMPGYAWPSYASYPNYAGLTYPRQYSPTAWPYIGPFYPYPQVPLGWRKVVLEWDDGWWMLDFKSKTHSRY